MDHDHQDSIKVLLELEAAARKKLEAEKDLYYAVSERASAALTKLVIAYCSVFKPLAYRARKIGYDIPEVKTFYDFDYDRDMEKHIQRFVSDLLPSETKDGFVYITGKDSAVDREDYVGYVEYKMHVPVKYFEDDGLSIMQKDGFRISKELDAIEQDMEAKRQQDQDAKDRAVFEKLKKRFG